jgi:hypothetical protein
MRVFTLVFSTLMIALTAASAIAAPTIIALP